MIKYNYFSRNKREVRGDEKLGSPSNTFGRFHDDDIKSEMLENSNSIEILVDQMVEPLDLIWTNIGGSRGIFITRRIILNLLIFIVLIFLSTPAVFYNKLGLIIFT